MVETAVYGLIGALATAFVFLLALPAISARADRLAARRAALTAPLNAAEAQARLDAERAKRAVDVAVADRRTTEAREAEARMQIEAGRRAAVIAARDAELAETKTRLAETRAELRQRETDLRERDTEIGAREIALFGYEGQRDAAERRLAEGMTRMRAQGVEAEAARTRLERRIAELIQELNEVRRDSEKRLAAADDVLAQTRRKLSGSEAEARRLQLELEELEVALADSIRRATTAGERAAALDAARQEAAAALDGARAERDARQSEATAARAALADAMRRVEAVELGDAALRREIARLGRALVAEPDAPARGAM